MNMNNNTWNDRVKVVSARADDRVHKVAEAAGRDNAVKVSWIEPWSLKPKPTGPKPKRRRKIRPERLPDDDD
jgi:hypothetical protein